MSLRNTVSQVTHSGERLLSDYLELAKVEAQLRQKKMARAGVGITVAAVMGGLAWILIVVAAVALLMEVMQLQWAALIVAGFHLLAAAVGLSLARRPLDAGSGSSRTGRPERLAADESSGSQPGLHRVSPTMDIEPVRVRDRKSVR